VQTSAGKPKIAAMVQATEEQRNFQLHVSWTKKEKRKNVIRISCLTHLTGG